MVNIIPTVVCKLPGAADRLLSITEKEGEHRYKNEDKAVKLNGRGQIFAFMAALFSIGALFCRYIGLLLKESRKTLFVWEARILFS